MQVGTEKRNWYNGKLCIFDTSFVHSTSNESAERDRTVLLIRFFHPEVSDCNGFSNGFVPFSLFLVCLMSFTSGLCCAYIVNTARGNCSTVCHHARVFVRELAQLVCGLVVLCSKN
jgi:Aspartyl/Asparaginyl beta-hydroxylase